MRDTSAQLRAPDRRATRVEVVGRKRANDVAARLGANLKEARLAAGMLQREASLAAGISQPWWSQLELGRGAGASVETWARAAAAVDARLSAFLDPVAAADRPRDYQHLRRQQLIVSTARPGGWVPIPEYAIDTESRRSRSVDVFLKRMVRREIAIAEIIDWFSDVGDSIRNLDGKKATVAQRIAGSSEFERGEWAIAGLWIVRGTRQNRALVAEFGALLAARFPASSAAWIAALRDLTVPMPRFDGFVWTDVKGTTLLPARLRR